MKATVPRERPARAPERKRGLAPRNCANSKRSLCATTFEVTPIRPDFDIRRKRPPKQEHRRKNYDRAR